MMAMTTSSSMRVNALPTESHPCSLSAVMVVCVFLFSAKLDRPAQESSCSKCFRRRTHVVDVTWRESGCRSSIHAALKGHRDYLCNL
jgi:hypothetical protein